MERKKNAIIYARCSTEEQQQSGNSIEYQINQIKSHPFTQGCEIVGTYFDVISGTTFDRNELKKIFDVCRSQKGSQSQVDYLFIEKWDRFGRNTEMHFATVRQFAELGVEVNAVYQLIDFSQSMWPNFLGMYATTAHSESLNISQRTKNGIAQAQRNGYFTSNTPVGYTRVATGEKTRSGNDRKLMVPDPVKGPLVRQIVDRFIAGENRGELFHEFKDRLEIKKNVFYNIFTHIVYAGYVHCKAHNFLPEEIVKGKHEGIITLGEYNLMQEILKGNPGANRGRSWTLDEQQRSEYYLKGLLFSEESKKMTASKSRSRNGNRYAYYHTTGKNRKNINVDFAHNLVSELVRNLSFDTSGMAEMVMDVANEKRMQILAERSAVSAELKRVEKRIGNLEQKFLDNEIDSKKYNELTYKLSNQNLEYKIKYDELSQDLSFFDTFTAEKFEPLLNIDSIYSTSDNLAKSRLLKAMFPEGIMIDKDNRRVRTTYINQFFDVSDRKIKNCELVKLKRGLEFSSSPLKGGRWDSSLIFLHFLLAYFELVKKLKSIDINAFCFNFCFSFIRS
jgi:DNA invertase Pin-like site-specific DNA recombinase